MTELTFVVYPKSGERGTRVKGIMVGWTDRQIIDHLTSACRHSGWLSTQVDVYRQTPGGWTEPWGEVDLATGEYNAVPMTATYDGRLVVTKDGISACCRSMDICAMRKQIYTSRGYVMMLRSSENPKLGMAMVCCPFCGAKQEGGQ